MPFVCARTGFITARTAARPVKFTRWRRVAAEFIRTELKTTEDRRVRAGLRGAIEHLAGRHGMNAAEQREFANEVDAECCKFTAQGEPNASCEVIIEERDDQMEVKVRASSESTLVEHTSSRRGASAESSKDRPDGHPGQDSRVGRTADNGHFAATLVRRFHKNSVHT